MVQARIVLWILIFISIVCNMLVTNNINIAMVSMVQYRPHTNTKHVDVQCNTTYSNSTTRSKTVSHNLNRTFDWNEDDQNFILGAFYIFPWLSQFFGGVLSHKYGTKIVVGMSTFIGGIMSSMIPTCAYVSPKLVMVVRVVQGFIASVAFPAGLYTIIGHWCPPHERGKFMTVFLGTSIGIAIGYPIYGFIGESIGWEYIFHLTSVVIIVWFIAWQYYVYDTPDEHPRISVKEKQHIKMCLGESATREKLPVPWKEILTSVPFLVNIICQFGVFWGRFTQNIYIPSYFNTIHGMNAKENGVVSGIPFLLKSVLSYVSGVVADCLLKRKMMSKNNIRKLSTFISSVLSGAALIGVSYSYCNTDMAILFMSLCIILNACFMTGASVAIVDMSPNFCGILQGLCGTICMISGFISPALVSLLSRLFDDPLEQWKWIWLVTAAIYIIPGMMYVLISDSNLQPWNFVKKPTQEEEPLDKIDNH